MRPKYLEVAGLQSFRDMQKIDFDSLGETGLFGIFGPTGSGKSTILDAITFVLYGKVKRAERGTQGIINTHCKTATVSFTFELLKSGARKTYRVERTYQRKKGSDSSCEPKVARLIEVTEVGEIPVCDKATEVSQSIEGLLGLNHDDFTRAVVLPQNSFQEFLMLDNARKRDMLERIFYLEEYGNKLNEKLSRKMSALKSRVDEMRGTLAAYEDASDDALEEAGRVLQEASFEKERVEKELKQLEARFNEAKEVWQLVQHLEQIRQAEKEHLSLKGLVDEKREKLEKAVKAEGLLEAIKRVKELAGKLAKTVALLDEVCDKLPGVASDLTDTRGVYDKLRQEAEAEKPRLIEYRTRLSDALGIRKEISSLEIRIGELAQASALLQADIEAKSAAVVNENDEIEDIKQKIGILKSEIESLSIDPEHRSRVQEVVKLENEIETLGVNMSALKKKAESLQHLIAGHEEELKTLAGKTNNIRETGDWLNNEQKKHQSLKPEDRNTIQQFNNRVYNLQVTYSVLEQRNTDLERRQTGIQKMQETLRLNLEAQSIQEEGVVLARAFYDQCSKQKECAVKAIEANTAYMLARDLKEGDPCPVCGSEHHPSLAQAEGTELALLEKQVEEAENGLRKAEKNLKAAENQLLITTEQVRMASEQIRLASEELAEKRLEYGGIFKELPGELRKFELKQLGEELTRMQSLGEAKLEKIEMWEKRAEELRSAIVKSNEELSVTTMEESNLLSGLKVNKEHKMQLEKEMEDIKAVYDSRFQEYQEFLGNLSIGSAAKELNRIAENDRKLNRLQKEADLMQDTLGKKAICLESLKEELRDLTTRGTKLQSETGNLQSQKDERIQKIRTLVGDADIEDEIKQVDEKITGYVSLDRRYQDRLKDLESQHAGLVTQITTLENQRDIYKANLEREQESLRLEITAKGFTDQAEAENSVVAKDEQKVLQEEISKYEKDEKDTEAEKRMVVRRLRSRSITEEEWENTDSEYQEKTAYKETCSSRYEVAKNSFTIIKQKHDKWVELSKSYNELTHKHGLFEQIQKLLRAERGKDNSFIDYIAEERLRYVAARASETLGLVTKYKYALELDTNMGFIIRDNANGGVHRMVTTLSGGETFLTSLSLALALSEQIQLKGQSPLEFFFLDEGFGTLDYDLLDTVIDSLERLSSKERVIGLISHVPELRSRIGRRLIVDQPTYQGDGSRVRVERV
jgi:exonuclease SbcC